MAVKIGKSEIASSHNGLVIERKEVDVDLSEKEEKELQVVPKAVDVDVRDYVVEDVQKKVSRVSRKKVKKSKD